MPHKKLTCLSLIYSNLASIAGKLGSETLVFLVTEWEIKCLMQSNERGLILSSQELTIILAHGVDSADSTDTKVFGSNISSES